MVGIVPMIRCTIAATLGGESLSRKGLGKSRERATPWIGRDNSCLYLLWYTATGVPGILEGRMYSQTPSHTPPATLHPYIRTSAHCIRILFYAEQLHADVQYSSTAQQNVLHCRLQVSGFRFRSSTYKIIPWRSRYIDFVHHFRFSHEHQTYVLRTPALYSIPRSKCT